MNDLERIKRETGYGDNEMRKLAEEAQKQHPEIAELHDVIIRAVTGHSPCDCCGSTYRNDCVIGYQCSCGYERCAVCHKCRHHCTCAAGYKTAEQSMIEKLSAALMKSQLEIARLRKIIVRHHEISRPPHWGERCQICEEEKPFDPKGGE